MAGNLNVNWDDVLKKEARGLDDADLGEVQEVSEDYVVTEKGIADKTRYLIPKRLVSEFDGHNLIFNISELDSLKYKQFYTD